MKKYVSLTPRFSGVWAASREPATVSTVSHRHEHATLRSLLLPTNSPCFEKTWRNFISQLYDRVSPISSQQRAFPHLTHLTHLTHVTLSSPLIRTALVLLVSLLLPGCLFKSATVSPRHFVLSPIATNQPAPVAETHLSVGIAHVKMPPYLLHDSIAYRDGANEIGYLEDATWGERLDQCLQRTLVANLSQLLSSDNITTVDSGHNQTMMCVLVNVDQFDVDARGHGTLIAQWRITGPEKENPLKSGRAELSRAGPSPHGHPEAIATTLSDLAAAFSRDLAQSIRQFANSSP